MKFKYPRVSEILEPYSSMSLANVPKVSLENAAMRGTILHTYCTAYARGDFIPPLNEDYKPYYNSFVQWYDEKVEELIFSETRLYHDDLQYCGQPDLIVRLFDSSSTVLIDIKSSYKIYQTHPVQLAAYMDLSNINGLHCDKGIILKLNKEGKIAREYDYEDCNKYYKIFLQAVSLYDYFLRPKTSKKGGKK
jgi:hypothetical protein